MKYRLHAFLALFAALLLSACASAPVLPLVRPTTESQAEVLIFRESSFIAGGVGLAVGANGKAFASISNSEKVRALLPAGRQEIFVQARSAEPTKVPVNLSNGAVVCLRTSSSPSTLAKVVVPITLIATGYHFYLDEVPCPSSAELSKYKDVSVTYQ